MLSEAHRMQIFGQPQQRGIHSFSRRCNTALCRGIGHHRLGNFIFIFFIFLTIIFKSNFNLLIQAPAKKHSVFSGSKKSLCHHSNWQHFLNDKSIWLINRDFKILWHCTFTLSTGTCLHHESRQRTITAHASRCNQPSVFSSGPNTPIFLQMASAVALLSPVMTMTRIPARRHSSMESRTSARGGSNMATHPTNVMLLCTSIVRRKKV